MNNNNNRNNKNGKDNDNKKNLNKKVDPSNNEIINPFFTPLHGCNRKKNPITFHDPSKNLIYKFNNQRDLNDNNQYFNMTFRSILDEIRQNRNKNNKLNGAHNNMKKSLDKTKQLAIVPIDKDKKETLHDFLKTVGDKYNLLYDDLDKPRENTIVSNWSKNYRPRRNATWAPGLNGNIRIAPPSFPPLPRPQIPPQLPPPPPIEKKKVFISREINGLDDILKLIDDFPLKVDVEYNIDMNILHNINTPLRELNAMIGMTKLKDSIIDQVIYFIQGLDKNNDFMHTVIYGPPGTGKTEVAKIMGSIFSSIGILNKNTFRKVTRSDLIAGYLGQTAMKTKDVIKEALGGVLFIDEAYALGNSEKKDSFAKECIDTLCEALSDHKSKIMVIIAGYEEDLNKCFFAYNQGLDSRFPWRFHTDDYTAPELKRIFIKKIHDIKWSIAKEIDDQWFESKMEYFKYYGRDMETLLAKTKIAHGRRVFCKPKKDKTVLTETDLDRGFEMFIDNNEVKERMEHGTGIIQHMYI